MIGQVVTKDGVPMDNLGNALTTSKYEPPAEVKKLFARIQNDYQNAWRLQRKPLDEFDGYNLLERTKLDQQTFSAFVGLEYQPKHKKWRWRGRKNTARNKLIGILAHLIAGMLFPFVYAQNDNNEEDKMTARVMRILVEERLRRANYETKFMYLVLSALVNPAVFAHVEYIEAVIRTKQKLANGTIQVVEAADEVVSGLNLYILPIDEIMLGDFWCGTGQVQRQPYIFRVRRIPYEYARSIHAGKHFYNGKDLFDYVQANGNLVWCSENSTLFDVPDSEMVDGHVQELTVYYRDEDLQLTWVGSVGMFDYANPYGNPFKHRRMVPHKDSWVTIPVYPIAMSGFEPLDPAGRFVWFKSGAFKEYWEDKKINELDRLAVDGIKLDVIKPIFYSGVQHIDSTVIVPGASVGMPQGASVTPYALSPNIAATYKAIQDANQDMSESTQDKVMAGITEPGVTATQTREAMRQARIFLGVFGMMVADLVRQIGELTMDCIVQHSTVGELDATVPEALALRYKAITAKGKEKGKDITHRIVFTDKYMGRNVSADEARNIEWDLFDKAGGKNSDQMLWEINPYQFARTRFTMTIDADRIVMRSMGMDRAEKDLAFERLTDPRVMPFTDPEAVANDLVIEEYSDGDPERYKRKGNQQELINAIMGMGAKPAVGVENQPTPMM